MGVMGQGLVLMVFGMAVVYLFLWLMIVVVAGILYTLCR